MKWTFFPIIIFLLTPLTINARSSSLDSLLIQLDEAIENNKSYTEKKEEYIAVLKKRSELVPPLSLDKYSLNMQLYKEYKAFMCDSAFVYLNRNIRLAQELNDKLREYECVIELAYLMGSTGMYKEGVDKLYSIDHKILPPNLLVPYYAALDHIYGELAFYTQDKESSKHYASISKNYKDSLHSILPQDDELLMILKETACRDNRMFEEARKINDYRMQKTSFGTPKYALITFHRALLHQQEGDKEKERYYLALSALSDIRSATKDHASLWMLADLLFQDKDIERAYTYIRFSWSETVAYNARLRSLQSAGILSLIDKTYNAMFERKNQQLKQSLIYISILSFLLILALIFIYRQMKKLSVARNNLQIANKQLNVLNDDLKEMNNQLQSTNLELFESNQIKEEYIGRFIKLCSTYIDKLDAYRRMVNKKIAAGKTQELFRLTKNEDFLENELKELYMSFDTAFLQLFPDFVNQFNNLLKSDCQVIPKKGELLNTELRIFALIRLGIDDSSQIAEFLRYSVNTIYNYRAKVKNKADILRDDFEEKVKNIR